MLTLSVSNVLLVFIGAINLLFGLVLLVNRKHSSTAQRSFSMLAACVAAWTFTMAYYRHTDVYVSAQIALRLLYMVPLCIPAAFVYFAVAYVRGVGQLYTGVLVQALIVVAAAILGALVACTDMLVRAVTLQEYSEKVIEFGTWYPLYIVYFVTSFSFGFALLWDYWRNVKELSKRHQAFFLLLGTITSSSVALLTNLVLPWMGYFALNWAGNVATVLFVGFIFYSVLRHGLFEVKLLTVEVLAATLWFVLLARVATSDGWYDALQNVGIFIVGLVMGIAMIKNVMHETAVREQGERLARYLANANARLRELDRQKTEFVSVASHQLRSPVAAIMGYASNMSEGLYGKVPKGLEQPIERIMDSGRRVSLIIDDFLNVTRIEQGHMSYNSAPHNVCTLVSQAVGDVQVLAEHKGLALRVTVPEHPVMVIADEGKLKQVVSNLVDNAIKYTPKGSVSVTVSEEVPAGLVQVTVSDTGIGVEEKEICNLFQKFSRASNANKSSVQGTGLGLYIAREIVKAHSGTITVQSDGPDKGTTFVITLPLASAVKKAPQAAREIIQ